MTTRMDIRASNLSNSLFSSFFLASVPPNSASGSKAASESLLWGSKMYSSSFVSSTSFEAIALAGRGTVGLPVVRRGEKRLHFFLAKYSCGYTYSRRVWVPVPTQKSRSPRTPCPTSCARGPCGMRWPGHLITRQVGRISRSVNHRSGFLRTAKSPSSTLASSRRNHGRCRGGSPSCDYPWRLPQDRFSNANYPDRCYSADPRRPLIMPTLVRCPNFLLNRSKANL